MRARRSPGALCETEMQVHFVEVLLAWRGMHTVVFRWGLGLVTGLRLFGMGIRHFFFYVCYR